MSHPRFADGEIGKRGEAFYWQILRPIVETPENIGKLLSIDIETGDYEIGDDKSPISTMARKLHEKHKGAAVYTLRIGYNAVVSFGGVIERVYTQGNEMSLSNQALSSQDVGDRGEALYRQTLRAIVETSENIGKLLSIDIETGNYEIGDDKAHIASVRKLKAKHSDAAVYTLRIGYNAVVALGGVLERVSP